MAHYALLDENNIVTNVIVGADEGTDGIDWEAEYSRIYGQKCVRTSYNTHGNTHSEGKQPFRKNYAIIGGIYDEKLDAFYEQQPYPSWKLNRGTGLWMAPIPEPNDDKFIYAWNEEARKWQKVKPKYE